jgi:ribosomal protein S27E
VEQLLADAGEIYTLSNQGSGDQIEYNYLHDISASQWADYWINGIYLDEQTSGYTVSNNVFSNAPSGVACNSCGSNPQSNNTGSAASTISGAGIESAYADIKNNLTVPLPVFVATTGILGGGSRASAADREVSARMQDGRLVVLAPRAEGATGILSVFDLQGKCVARASAQDAVSGAYSVDLTKEPVGQYLAVLQSDKARYSAAFVKL